MNKMRENFQILGKYLDIAEEASLELLLDLFPNVTQYFISDYERIYALKSTGTDVERRNRILSAMIQRGGLSKSYFESIGNKLGDGSYAVSIAEGSEGLAFIVASEGPFSSPPGPATTLPGTLRTVSGTDSFYHITVTVTGSAGPENELEKLYERLKPAWTSWEYVYIP